jgi:hypothetical protein
VHFADRPGLSGISHTLLEVVTIFCVRPGLRGQCAMTRSSSSDTATAQQLAELREEVRVLRAQDSLDGGCVPRRHPEPRADA